MSSQTSTATIARDGSSSAIRSMGHMGYCGVLPSRVVYTRAYNTTRATMAGAAAVQFNSARMVGMQPAKKVQQNVPTNRRLSASTSKDPIVPPPTAQGQTTSAGGGGPDKFGKYAALLGLPVGGIAGLFGSMVGVGGGIIMVPMITCKPLSLQVSMYASCIFSCAPSLVAHSMQSTQSRQLSRSICTTSGLCLCF